MNRIAKHELPKQRVAARLRRLGLAVEAEPANLGHDLVVDGGLRISLRVAFPSKRHHHVTVAGRTYSYRYNSWHFNFHHHGEMREQYADFVVCVAVPPRGVTRTELFVIPWDRLSGKTFSLHAGRRRYAGKYAPYRDAWHLVTEAVQASSKRLHAA